VFHFTKCKKEDFFSGTAMTVSFGWRILDQICEGPPHICPHGPSHKGRRTGHRASWTQGEGARFTEVL
jgi:hypothetical protein